MKEENKDCYLSFLCLHLVFFVCVYWIHYYQMKVKPAKFIIDRIYNTHWSLIWHILILHWGYMQTLWMARLILLQSRAQRSRRSIVKELASSVKNHSPHFHSPPQTHSRHKTPTRKDLAQETTKGRAAMAKERHADCCSCSFRVGLPTVRCLVACQSSSKFSSRFGDSRVAQKATWTPSKANPRSARRWDF